MALWKRRELVKERTIHDGELVRLMTSESSIDVTASQVYASISDLFDQVGKATARYVAANVLALLAYFNVLEHASAAGLEVARAAFRPVALLALSASALLFTSAFSKLQYAKQWFEWQFQQANGPDRAALLLLYPRAFWYFAYYSSSRRYPRDMFPRRTPLLQLAPAVLLLLALGLWFVIGSALWLALAVDVWRAGFPTAFWSRCTIIVSSILAMLAFTGPQYGWKRRYLHYGLVNLLHRLPDDRKLRAFRRIYAAQVSMGLVKAPPVPPGASRGQSVG